jgi:hypothetical protein
MPLWGDWSLHGLQASLGTHGRFDERPCPAESARSPTADRAEPIRTPRNVAGNLPLPDADVPVPCARHAETCARVPERRRRKLRTPGRGICRLGRRLRISARHTVSLVGDGSRLAAARVSPLPASRRGASASLCALQAGVSGPMVMLRTWRASATLEAVRSSGCTWACCIVASASGQGRQATQSPGATCWTSIDLSCAASRSRPGASSASTYSFMPVMP